MTTQAHIKLSLSLAHERRGANGLRCQQLVWRASAQLAFIILGILPSTARAQLGFFRVWTAPTGGSYANPFNWNPTGVPNDKDGAGFQLDATYTVAFPSSQKTGTVSVSKGNVTLDLNSSGTARTLTVPGTLTVAGANNATLVIEDGTVTAGNVMVTGTGFLDINADFGGDSILNVNGDVVVDGGRLRKLGGDQFNLSPGGEVTVQNGGDFDYVNRYHLHEGNTFRAASGGTIEFSSLDIAGTGASGDGALVVEGTGSTVTSDFAVSQQIWGANGRTATIEITGGGRVDIEEEDLQLASDGSSATATITIDGPDSVFAHHDGGAQIVLGHAASGSAVINVLNGGLFTAEAGSAGNGRVILNATGEVHANSGGMFDARFIDMNGGSVDFAGGTLRFLSYSANLVNPSGTLDVGRTLGSSFINGNYTQQAAGSLKVEIAGILPGQADKLTVTGNAIVGGTLDVQVLDDFVPVMGNQFTIVETSIGNVASEFDAVDFPVFDGMTFDVVYNPKSVVLEVVKAELPGDFDLDGDVDGIDFLEWQRGESPNPRSTSDLVDWQIHFGEATLASTTTAVPEPAAWVLASLGTVALLRVRKSPEVVT